MTPLAAGRLLFLHARLAATLGLRSGVADTAALGAALQDGGASIETGDLFERAAALADALARHRPFRAANLALAAAAACLLLREFDLDVQVDAAAAPALRSLLAGDDRAALVAWLRSHTAPRSLE
ncbi:MAG TPA: hypothetical protein VII06_24740 [Chloroflexota bacterium]|jgi:prophage maintenance system killer protein